MYVYTNLIFLGYFFMTQAAISLYVLAVKSSEKTEVEAKNEEAYSQLQTTKFQQSHILMV